MVWPVKLRAPLVAGWVFFDRPLTKQQFQNRLPAARPKSPLVEVLGMKFRSKFYVYLRQPPDNGRKYLALVAGSVEHIELPLTKIGNRLSEFRSRYFVGAASKSYIAPF
jgi:hypothetical protein